MEEIKVNIYGKKVFLRGMESEDMEMYREMANDPNTERLLGGWSFPISTKEQTEWYEKAVADKRNLRFTIVVQETEEAIGMVNLVDIDWKNGSAFHGIRMSAKRGKGYGTDAVMTLMKYAFEELQLNRLYGSILEYNIASQKLYAKCGWKVEGNYRQSVFKNNAYHDEWPVAILRDEYFEWKENRGK